MTIDALAQLRDEMEFMHALHLEVSAVAAQAKSDGMAAEALVGIRNVAEKLLLRQADLRDLLAAEGAP